MNDSVLSSIKKVCNVPEEYSVFDQDLILHINSVFSTLAQLGVGPETGYHIEDDSATWVGLLGTDPRLNMVKSYVGLRVRMLFDPPATSFHLEAMNGQIKEAEWRMVAAAETVDDPDVFDGGSPSWTSSEDLDGGTP